MTAPLNIVFAGTPEFAAAHLTHLIKGPHRVVGVLTQPDRRAGRGKKLQPSAVKSVALDANIPLWQPDTLKRPGRRGTVNLLRCRYSGRRGLRIDSSRSDTGHTSHRLY
jgi:methionyl-tRNA formyltransferase